MTGNYLLWGMVSLFVFLTIYYLVKSHRSSRRQLPPSSSQPHTPAPPSVPPFIRLPTGLVSVLRESLAAPANKPIPWEVAKMYASPYAEQMLCFLTLDEMYEAVFFATQHENKGEEWVNERKRGMTIGSALFNYPIPESFVLIDHRTRILYARYFHLNAVRMEYNRWLDSEKDFFRSRYHSVTQIEQETLGVTKEQAVLFYNQHYRVLVLHLTTQSAHWANFDGFRENMLKYKLKVKSDNLKTRHCFAIAINVLAFILELRMPKDWVMTSELTYSVMFSALGIPENKAHPHLKLVVNKERYEPKYEY